ncbi:hypothetical protein CTheo_3111 [Ceratobasidium theobromae]|uniref:Uncharacterized protein n=1 Tax=Ceratobasidium theobromae TaxID=1582974 RepID=A0A5N5QQH7_9AGAM|nr:hypothetical protein CTheo_3111 [Ceratobasidium theobromae]
MTGCNDQTLSGHDAESFINHACSILRSIYGHTPDNLPDPRLNAAPPPALSKHIQGLYFPEPLATRQPTVSWYIANLSYYARASAGVFHTALAYLERAKPRFRPIPPDPRTAFVAALILAHRFLEDGSYRTETWARLSGSSSRMISACVEAMFDALEHRLWLGPLPSPPQNKMFSMREGTIFSEEMLGGQRRCSLPSLSSLYGARTNTSTGARAFGDPQGIPTAIAPIQVAGPSNLAPTSAANPKPVQGLPSPPDSPSSASVTPPVARPQKAPTPARLSAPDAGLFNFAHWQAAEQFGAAPSGFAPPPPPCAPTQRLHTHGKPPPVYVPPPLRSTRATNSPVFNVAQWCAPIPELAEEGSTISASASEMEVEREMETTLPQTPSTPLEANASGGGMNMDVDAFDPRMWAAQAVLFPPQPSIIIGPPSRQGSISQEVILSRRGSVISPSRGSLIPPQTSLVTPAPTIQLESPEKTLRYPSATLVPPSSCLDPAWNGRRHSIAVSGTRY